MAAEDAAPRLLTSPPHLDDESFWESREVLRHIRDGAYANIASPWHILALAIEGALQQIPYSTEISTDRDYGVHANFAAVLYGRTGSGKSSAQHLIRRLFEWGRDYRPIGIRSGEGIVDSYGEWEDVTVPAVGGAAATTTRVFKWSNPEHAKAFLFDEVTDFTAKSDRSGSTLKGTILSMITCSTIGGVRAGGRNSTIPAGTYRATLVVGAQPGRCETLLSAEDQARGTPGRFLWARAGLSRSDKDRVARVRESRKGAPEKVRVGLLDWPAVMGIDEQIREDLEEFGLEYAMGDSAVDPIDGHRGVNTLKTAAALAVLDGRTYVTEDDWDLSRYLWSVSDEVRSEAVEAQYAAMTERADEKGRERALSDRAENDFKRRVDEYTRRALEKGFLPGSKPVGEPWKKFRAMFSKTTRPVYMQAVIREMHWDE